MQSHWDKLPTIRVVDAGYLLAGMKPKRKWQFAPPLVKNFFNLIREKTGAVKLATMPGERIEITQAEFQALEAEYGVTPATEPKAMPDTANPEQTNYQETPQYQAEYAKAWKSLDAKDELEKLIKECEAIPALDWGQLKRKKQEIAAMKVERAGLLAGIFPGDSQQQATEPPAPPVVTVSASETREQRQNRRLQACEKYGLVMPKSYLSRLPDGVGDVADRESVTRQAFSTDVKAALKRRENAIREGITVHRG